MPVANELKTKEYIIAWLKRQPTCECCGVTFLIGPKENGGASDASPSFDQIVPGNGYLLSNVALICWRCNNIKRNYTSKDLRLVAGWIDRRSYGNEVTKFNPPKYVEAAKFPEQAEAEQATLFEAAE